MSETAAMPRGSRPSLRFGRLPVVAAIVLGLTLFAVAYWRGGLLDLPPVPSGITPEAAGLDTVSILGERARALDAMVSQAVEGVAPQGDLRLKKAAEGIAAVRRGEGESGLQAIRQAVSEQPDDLVIGNTYRMSVISLRHSTPVNSESRQTLAEHLPSYLQGEPVTTLEPLYREHPSREAGFQLAMGWIDQVLLSAKPEEFVGALVESMKVLNEILARHPYYLPALCARGVGALNPPKRIILNPKLKQAFRPVPDAASRDLALCAAIGRQVGGGSSYMAGMSALNLGDAYAKEGQLQRARSWWQLAQNASRAPALLEAVRRRYTWQDGEVLDRLEAEIESRNLDIDHPVTDLSIMWRP